MKSFCFFFACCLAICLGQQCRDEHGTPYRQGEEPQINDSWFRCHGGHLLIQGCITPRGGKIAIGETIDHKGYEMTCRPVSPKVARLIPTSCIFDNEKVRAGQSVRTHFFVYTCRDQGNGVAMDITACIDDTGREITTGQTLVRGEYLYQCSLTNGYISLVPVGCIYDGVEHPANTSFSGNKFWFTCEKNGNTIRRRIDGCLDGSGQRVQPGTNYHKNGFVITCKKTHNAIITPVVGCVQKLTNGKVREQPVGSNWVEGTPPFEYTVACTTCSDGTTVMKSRTKCKLGGDFNNRLDPIVELEPGCMRRSGLSELASCGTTNGGALELNIDQFSEENVEKRRQNGYRMC